MSTWLILVILLFPQLTYVRPPFPAAKAKKDYFTSHQKITITTDKKGEATITYHALYPLYPRNLLFDRAVCSPLRDAANAAEWHRIVQVASEDSLHLTIKSEASASIRFTCDFAVRKTPEEIQKEQVQ